MPSKFFHEKEALKVGPYFAYFRINWWVQSYGYGILALLWRRTVKYQLLPYLCCSPERNTHSWNTLNWLFICKLKHESVTLGLSSGSMGRGGQDFRTSQAGRNADIMHIKTKHRAWKLKMKRDFNKRHKCSTTSAGKRIMREKKGDVKKKNIKSTERGMKSSRTCGW